MLLRRAMPRDFLWRPARSGLGLVSFPAVQEVFHGDGDAVVDAAVSAAAEPVEAFPQVRVDADVQYAGWFRGGVSHTNMMTDDINVM